MDDQSELKCTLSIIQAPFLKMYADYENRYETALSIYTNFMKDQAFGNKVRVSKAKPSQARPFACLIS